MLKKSQIRKTKIICTLGPSTDNEDTVRELILNGMDVARINMSHGAHKDQKERADMVKKIRKELNKPVALLMDTKGPEIRTKKFKDGSVILEKGQKFVLYTDDREGDETGCAITFAALPQDIKEGATILIDDGLIALTVQEVFEEEIVCRVMNGGKVSNNKGINVPGCELSMPYVSATDVEDIKFAIKEDFDFIAASFVRTKDDVAQIRQALEDNNCTNMKLVSKIENAQGVENIDEIIRVSDAIMVARGDMGVEINLEEIPKIQKELIKKAYTAGKQVVTATQMLESMVKNPRPTRAETTDVANAIYDGTSAIMLSGETAAGDYPIEALRTMNTIACYTEKNINYKTRFSARNYDTNSDVTSAISHATCTTAHDLGAVAILTATKTGQTAKLISKYRPDCPIICGCMDEKVLRQMNMSWGVAPLLMTEMKSTDELFEKLVGIAENAGYVECGDIAVITAGIPLGISGTTNMLKVHVVGNVLVEGITINKGSVTGRLCVCKTEDEAKSNFIDGDIIVMPSTSNAIMPLLRKASGIITESDGLTSHAAIAGLALDIPVLIGAENATEILTSGTVVRIEGDKGIVLSLSK